MGLQALVILSVILLDHLVRVAVLRNVLLDLLHDGEVSLVESAELRDLLALRSDAIKLVFGVAIELDQRPVFFVVHLQLKDSPCQLRELYGFLDDADPSFLKSDFPFPHLG